MVGLVLAGALLAPALWAQSQPAATAQVSKDARKDAAAVAKQRTAVQQLQNDVAAQEASSKAAAEKLKEQDAEITRLQEQLQATQQAGEAARSQH
ncbi:hypothetical protein [Rhodanobacter sp. DHG33]|uniref:hypothetical protein n=1 Tax=Rhodanobacter sp. DHG33 TaxID=2775921 RepID=UPI00177FE317|nr:hypothetical protein [Rhodanobacter sp. DHG33]MBD8900269.1 hypothetical protein [Rhodanobacter sp. DHG33]